MKIILTDQNTHKDHHLTQKELARFAVELHGGGFNEDQVFSAMQWQQEVLNGNKPVEFKFKGFSFTVEVKADAEGAAA